MANPAPATDSDRSSSVPAVPKAFKRRVAVVVSEAVIPYRRSRPPGWKAGPLPVEVVYDGETQVADVRWREAKTVCRVHEALYGEGRRYAIAAIDDPPGGQLTVTGLEILTLRLSRGVVITPWWPFTCALGRDRRQPLPRGVEGAGTRP